MTDTATIVVVDDAADVRLLIKTRLRLAATLRVVGEGATGADAVSLAAQHRPDVMLLDVSMPDMDGLEALPRVREVSPATRVVLFSGFEEQGLAERARQLGATEFIEKSLPVDELVEHLAQLADRADAGTAAAPESPAAPRTSARSVSPEAASLDQSVLDEHLERFREVFDEAAIGMATMTLTGHLVRANRALATLVQRPAGTLVGAFYGDLVEDAEPLRSALGDIQHKSLDMVTLEHGLRGAAAGRHVRAILAPVRDSAGRPLYLFLQVQDVTAERLANDELRRSEERFRMLVEAVEDYAIFMLDTTGHIVSWNSGAQRTKGYSAEEIIGQHFRVFYPREVAESGHPEHELELALRDGHYEEEGWRLRKDGTRFWANVLITAVCNDVGEHIGFAKVTRDTTERRRLEQERERALEALATANAELESLNAQLQQATQDQAQFLAVTAHELRTPIGVLGGSAETLARHHDELTREESADLFDAMTSNAARLRRLLADLLTASRLQSSKLEIHHETVRLADVAAEAVATVRRQRPDADVVCHVPEDVVVSGDHDRLTQVVDNLLSNALRHGRPPIDVTVRRHDGQVEVRVSDAGPGVPEAMAPRLFQRFATGQKRGGTGLGLFIVRELAHAQGGEAFYEPQSTEHPSGVFVVRLPMVADAQ
jgi:PAS domain S-box-containing protein